MAYLKISEGCDRLCTFCTIPSIRGKHVSKPIEAIAEEAKQLAAEGVRELVLVAQDLTSYGRDLYDRPALAELLLRLEEIEGVDWIRLLYLYPEYVTDELIDVLARGGKVLPYLDLPLQHINDRVLRRMNRRVDRAQTELLLDRPRADPRAGAHDSHAGFPGDRRTVPRAAGIQSAAVRAAGALAPREPGTLGSPRRPARQVRNCSAASAQQGSLRVECGPSGRQWTFYRP